MAKAKLKHERFAHNKESRIPLFCCFFWGGGGDQAHNPRPHCGSFHEHVVFIFALVHAPLSFCQLGLESPGPHLHHSSLKVGAQMKHNLCSIPPRFCTKVILAATEFVLNLAIPQGSFISCEPWWFLIARGTGLPPNSSQPPRFPLWNTFCPPPGRPWGCAMYLTEGL